jgi:enoyl-[acyl-carrier-protein] reductase (NADH)
MARRNPENEKRIDISGLDKQTIAAVAISQMIQVQTIADTLPEGDRNLLYQASNLVLDLLKGYTSEKIVELAPQINSLLAGECEVYSQEEIDEIKARVAEMLR